MTHYYLELDFHLEDGNITEKTTEYLVTVAEHLDDLDGMIDADLAVNLATNVFTFTLATEAADSPTALRNALAAVRSAFHASGAATPGWETAFSESSQTVQAQPWLVDA